MCLTTRNGEGFVAKEPIKCYKYYRIFRKKNVIYSSNRYVEYDFKTGMMIEAEENPVITDMGGMFTLGIGFIHAFREFDFACKKIYEGISESAFDAVRRQVIPGKDYFMNLFDDLWNNETESYCICEMEIPAGEKYYMGKFGDICARRMILKKELTLDKIECLKGVRDRLAEVVDGPPKGMISKGIMVEIEALDEMIDKGVKNKEKGE